MARWSIEPSWKKSIVEREYWTKGDNTVVIETGWRWGTFECETEDDNIPDITSGDDLWDCGYDVELIETWDGCWTEHDLDDCDDETREWLEEFFEEHSSYELEEVEGWVQGDSEMIIDCDPIFTRLDGPNEGKRYNVDGEEIKEDGEEESETVITESIKLNTPAAWPFDNATIVEAQTEVKWPFEYPKEGKKEE